MIYALLLICSIDAAPDALIDAMPDVTITVSAEVAAPAPVAAQAMPAAPTSANQATAKSAGCANGQCRLPQGQTAPKTPAATGTRYRFFRWRQ